MTDSVRTIRAILDASFAADRRLTLALAALAVVGWIVIPFQAVAIKLFVDAIVGHDAALGTIAAVATGVTMGGLWYFNNLRQFVRMTLQERAVHELDQRVQRLASELDGIEHLERPDYLDRLATLRAQGQWFGNVGAIFEFPALLLNVTVSAVLLVAIDPVLALVPLGMLPPIWLGGRSERVLLAAETAAAPARRLRARFFQLGTDPAVAGEARLFGAGDELLRRHIQVDRRVRQVLARAAIRDVVLSAAGWGIYTLAFALVFLVVVGGIRTGRLGIGDLFLGFFLVRGLTWQAQFFFYSIANFRRTLSATRGYLWLVDHVAERRRNRPSAHRPLPAPGPLRFDHVSFRYPGAARDALTDVTMTVGPGSVIALVGDNGAGKTTLVKLLARLYEPTGGRITLDGEEIATVETRAWRAALTACFQDFCRFELRLRETVGVGNVAEIETASAVRTAVGAAAADDVLASLPDGLETPLGSSWASGAELSVGQWQKVALARSMMRRAPRILLLDEPTAALDAASEARLFERYAAASEFARATGSITVIVSHRMSTVRMADVIGVVENGRLTEYGTHGELMERRGTYHELYSTQAAAYA